MKLCIISPDIVQQFYTQGIFPFLGRISRWSTGWIYFSAGDLLYGLIPMLFIIHWTKRKQLKGNLRSPLLARAVRLLNVLLLIYLVFNLMWGLNYNKISVAENFKLNIAPFKKGELQDLAARLVTKLNVEKAEANTSKVYQANFSELKDEVKLAYDSLHRNINNVPAYEQVSLKPSMWGWLGNYSGFTGYYNPFTAEAQVNTTIPKFEHAFVACHEAAHQLGFAKENEANFIGYLACISSKKAYLQYSAHLALLSHVYRQLFRSDSIAAKLIYGQLAAPVLADIAEIKAFNKAHRSFLQPLTAFFYDKFLLANEQPSGLGSYDEVVGLVIAYRKKTGQF